MIACRNQHDTFPAGSSTRVRRSGAALLEGTIVLGVFVTVIFILFDLGLAVMRQNTLAEAARRLAREAIVHGERASPDRSVWGPAQATGNAGDGSEIATVLEAALVTLDPAEVTYELVWPDSDNRSGDRVSVTLEYPHRAILPQVLGSGTLALRSESTMHIER